MQSLEARVAYLERLLRETRPDVATDHFGKTQLGTDRRVHSNLSSMSPQSGAFPTTANAGSGSILIEADEVGNDLASDVAFLALSASGREPQYFGPSSALSFSRVASSTLGLRQRRGGSQISGESERPSNVPRDWKPITYPLLSVCERLSAAYFDNVHPQYPFLHHPTFLAWKEECLRAQQTGVLDGVRKVPLFFTLMVLPFLGFN